MSAVAHRLLRFVRAASLVAAVMVSAFAAVPAAAQCALVVSERALPRDVATPLGSTLSYSYDLAAEQYFVTVSRGEESSGPRGPFTLTRGCVPATLRWESERFVVLTAACGTFCWSATVLPVGSEAPSREVQRSLAFDADRDLLASYPDPGGVIEILDLATNAVQRIETPARCPSSHETCFDDLEITPDAVVYAWKYWRPRADGGFDYFEPEAVRVALDAALVRD